jgi:hypothetical protein
MTTYKYEDLFQDIPGDPDNVWFTIPEEALKAADLKEGDEIDITVENGHMVIKKHG